MYLKFETFYNTFFNKLECNSLMYCIVRNYETLPSTKPGGDVDILVEEDKLYEILNILNEIILPVKGRVEITSKHHYVIKLKIHNVLDDKSNLPVTELDLITKLSWKGLNWLSEVDVLKNSFKFSNDLFIPKSRHELQMSLFHSLLYGGFVKRRYCDKMASLFLISNKTKLKDDLVKNFGYDIGHFLLINIKDSNWDLIQNNVGQIRKALFAVRLKKSSIKTPFLVISHYYKEIKVRIKKILKK